MGASEFQDNVVIITGASSGIGAELARQLSAQGATLVIAARNSDALEAVRKSCTTPNEVLVVRCDVNDKAQCEHLVAETVRKYGRIDTLINNAGVGMHSNFEDLADPDVLDDIMRVNYMGSAYCTYFALPYIRKTRGRIVAVSSLTGKAGVPSRTGYAASKHAMAGFFDSLRIELRGSGVTVTVAYPGFVDTGIGERALGADGLPLGDRAFMRSGVMSTEECCRLIIQTAAARKREIVMTITARIGQWLKLIAPEFVDKMALAAIQKRYGATTGTETW
ncbi:MAG: SDR family oxidoreductase [Gemmatimonadaceae bacterium]|nr:SDR family oxidoreductase [Gemmatimonadaceae bacterium]